jgi:hypothetical protein
MSDIQMCVPVTYDEIDWAENDKNIVQMTFNGYPVNIEYSTLHRNAVITVYSEIEGWGNTEGCRYYKSNGDYAPIHALATIFNKGIPVICSNKKFSIAMVYRGYIDDVKNNFFSTSWDEIATRWEAISLDLWTLDASDEDMLMSHVIRSANEAASRDSYRDTDTYTDNPDRA